MYCTKCGTQNSDDAQVCSACGSVLSKAPVNTGDQIPRTSGLAIAAFVLGILSIFTLGLTIIPAIILGIVGIVVIEKSGGRLTGRVFAILGIVLPVFAFCAMFVILMPALSRAREQGKRVVCHGNLKQLTLAWIMYSDENDARIVNAVAGIDRREDGRTFEEPWTGKDWPSDYATGGLLAAETQEEALKAGALWPYCMTTKLYRCPAGFPGHMRTYSIVDSMNGIAGEGLDEAPGVYIKKSPQILKPAYRVVFIDVGHVIPDTYSVYYDQQKWWDEPSVRHGDGITLSFADGHSDYWRWRAAETVERGKAAIGVHSPDAADHWSPQTPEGKEDLQKMQNGCWGRLGY